MDISGANAGFTIELGYAGGHFPVLENGSTLILANSLLKYSPYDHVPQNSGMGVQPVHGHFSFLRGPRWAYP